MTMLSNEEALRAERIFGRMPYGGVCHFDRYNLGGGTTEFPVEVILANLDRLREVLDGVAKRDEHNEAELRRLRNDMAAFRRVLGTGSFE